MFHCMRIMNLMVSFVCFLLLKFDVCKATVQLIGKINPGFEVSYMSFIDNDGLFLLSNNTNFAFGFKAISDVTRFELVIMHTSSSRVIWSANRGNPVLLSDRFVFDRDGIASLQKGGRSIWIADTGTKRVSVVELDDSGNLVLRASEGSVVWQSFDYPTDTLILRQDFVRGMRLVSVPSTNNLTYVLEIKSGDMILSSGLKSMQTYWSMRKESRKTINKGGGEVALASLDGNSWRFFDSNKVLLWNFVFTDSFYSNASWVAVVGNDGFISFYNLDNAGSNGASPTKIPGHTCSRPESCAAYYVCSGNNICQCSSALGPNCTTGIVLPCDVSEDSTELVSAGDGLGYSALDFVSPFSKSDLEGCKLLCHNNCSCRALFFESNSGNCFLFDNIGSFQKLESGSDSVAYIKVLSNRSSRAKTNNNVNGKTGSPVVIAIIVVATVIAITGMFFVAIRYYRKGKGLPESPKEFSEDDNFLENISGMPTRFRYRELQTATNNFSEKLGQGGFGSVYLGVLSNGTRLAVKKLEAIGQGQKEFRAEVTIIGSIHHHHLVKLKGFCAEGPHRLLVYEFMANGSLDKWIFNKNRDEFILDWDTRFNIAVGTAKGLAYLHEDCDAKIIHCDIKPENVLIDDHFAAKVSDFGLAKLMTREQSQVFTTLRGTRGYLAPEWITNHAISEKSDVYSYGMVLLEIIGGRKNFDPNESSSKSHFPTYASKMMEEGKLIEIFDSKLQLEINDKRVGSAVKVAMWCIQEDMYLRPTMSKVVQMLEGLCSVPQPPTPSLLSSRISSNLFRPISKEGSSSGPSDSNSDANVSAVQLSGPR